MLHDTLIRKIAIACGTMIVIALMAYTYSTYKESQYMYSGPVSISVEGTGEVFAKPDIATFSFTVEAKEGDAVTAQNKSSETMASIIAYLKEKGVAEKDIKTAQYSLTPQYEYPQTVCTQWGCPPQTGEPKIVGYIVSQSVTVKVRDTAKAGELVSGIGEKGAQNVSGLSFTIDDEEALKAEAREKAILDAQTKAKVLAHNLGARIVRMNGYWDGVDYPVPYGIGGDAMMAKERTSSVYAPQPAELPLGENMIRIKVNISYEVR